MVWRPALLLMKRRPLLSQMVTAGTLGALGDGICQTVVEKRGLEDYDYPRTGRFFMLASCYIAPILYRWFHVLERVKGSAKILPLKRVFIDQLTFAPIFSASIIFNLRVLEGYSAADSLEKLQADFWGIYKRSLQYWPLVQIANFYLIPLHFRVTVVQVAALLWNCFLSYKTQTVAHEIVHADI
uniref:Mitochondrial inner membrane protein Mpv17 n=1 Tax=Steinernema glaseri TaxID=37863 RepID=A0A1I8A9E1_9BILA